LGKQNEGHFTGKCPDTIIMYPKAQNHFWENKMTSILDKCPDTIIMYSFFKKLLTT